MSEFDIFVNTIKSFIESKQKELDAWLASFKTCENPLLNFMLKAFGFSSIENFKINGKIFFNSLNKTTTYEGFVDILEAIFLTRDIQIENIEEYKLNITIHNNNLDILATYVDSNNNTYVDKDNNVYKSFLGADISSFSDFFRVFLQRFLIAGVEIKTLNLVVKSDVVGLIN